MPSPLFQLEQLCKTYCSSRGFVRALDCVDLSITQGELVVLHGPQGSGKSTLLNILAGLDHPSTGKAKFRNRDLSELRQRELLTYRKRNIGFVFPHANLIPDLSVAENIARVSDETRHAYPLREILSLVDMKDKGAVAAGDLDKEEQQRVAIARALSKRPEVLLCDEPTTDLDDPSGERLLALLLALNRKLNVTTVIINRNPTLAGRADHIYQLEDGHIAEDTGPHTGGPSLH